CTVRPRHVDEPSAGVRLRLSAHRPRTQGGLLRDHAVDRTSGRAGQAAGRHCRPGGSGALHRRLGAGAPRARDHACGPRVAATPRARVLPPGRSRRRPAVVVCLVRDARIGVQRLRGTEVPGSMVDHHGMAEVRGTLLPTAERTFDCGFRAPRAR
ncbi:MAG: hypothetical protein ACK56F_14865, partial [bacterium]